MKVTRSVLKPPVMMHLLLTVASYSTVFLALGVDRLVRRIAHMQMVLVIQLVGVFPLNTLLLKRLALMVEHTWTNAALELKVLSAALQVRPVFLP
jgi:hypothetical protein